MDKNFARRAHVELSGVVYVVLRRPDSAVLGLSPLFIAGVSGLIVDSSAIYGVWFTLTCLAVIGGVFLDTIFDHSDRKSFYPQSHLLALAAAWLASVIAGIVAASVAVAGATTFWAILATIFALWRLADIVSLAALDSQNSQQSFMDWLNHTRMRPLNAAYSPADGDSATIELEATDD